MGCKKIIYPDPVQLLLTATLKTIFYLLYYIVNKILSNRNISGRAIPISAIIATSTSPPLSLHRDCAA